MLQSQLGPVLYCRISRFFTLFSFLYITFSFTISICTAFGRLYSARGGLVGPLVKYNSTSKPADSPHRCCLLLACLLWSFLLFVSFLLSLLLARFSSTPILLGYFIFAFTRCFFLRSAQLRAFSIVFQSIRAARAWAKLECYFFRWLWANHLRGGIEQSWHTGSEVKKRRKN